MTLVIFLDKNGWLYLIYIYSKQKKCAAIIQLFIK